MITQFMELILCTIDAFLLYTFCSIILNEKVSDRIKITIYSIAYIVLIYVLSGLSGPYSGVIELVLLFMSIAYVNLIFAGNALTKSITAIVFYLVLGVTTAVVASFMMNLLSVESEQLFSSLSLRMLVSLIIKSCVGIIILIANTFRVKKKKNYAVKSKGLLVYLIASFIIIHILFEQLFLNTTTITVDSTRYLTFVFAFLFVITVILIYLYIMSKDQITEYNYLLKEMEFNEKLTSTRLNQDADILRIKHDLNNHLITINQLIKKNENLEAQKYIDTITKTGALATHINCQNSVINSILNTKISINEDIRFDVKLDIQIFDFDSVKLAIILGNALDNSIEAVMDLPVDERIVEVNISENNQFGKVVISNPYIGSLKMNGDVPYSTKNDNKVGIGMKSIQKSVFELGGFMDFSYDDNIFRVSIVLNKTKDKTSTK